MLPNYHLKAPAGLHCVRNSSRAAERTKSKLRDSRRHNGMMEFQLGAHGHHRFYLSKNPVLHVPLLNVAGHIQNEHLTYLSSQALVTATWTCNQQPFNPQKIQFCTFSGKQNCRGKQQPRVPRLSRLPGNAKGQERKT